MRRKITNFMGGSGKGVGEGVTHPSFKCFRVPEGVRNMVYMPYLLAKRPDYFVVIKEGIHALIHPFVVLAGPFLCLNTKTFSTFSKFCNCCPHPTLPQPAKIN